MVVRGVFNFKLALLGVLSIFVLGSVIDGFHTKAFATSFNIDEVEKWITVGPETFPGTPDKADGPSFRFNNTSTETWTNFHIRLSNDQTFVDINKEFALTKFSKKGLSPDKKTLNLWGGEVIAGDFFGVMFDVAPGGNIKFDVKATVPEPSTILLFGISLLGLAGVSRKKQ